MTYNDFLKQKQVIQAPTGLNVIPELNPLLFDFQKDIVRWLLKRGRGCCFADCGLGKTFMQLEIAKHIPGNILIIAPLSVCDQTIKEAEKFNTDKIEYSKTGEINNRITITNYERLHNFDLSDVNCIILDESSILKSHTGKFRTYLIENTRHIPFRYAFTATPAPNDFMELGNHSEFIGSMTRSEMLSMFFVHDGETTQKWRLKKHGIEKFWEWVASWSIFITKPSDLGYDDGDFILPGYEIKQITIESNEPSPGYLYPMKAKTLRERQAARKNTIKERCAKAAEIINTSDEIHLVWCNLNAESAELTKLINGAVEVKGATKPEKKKQAADDFKAGELKSVVTKPSIFGYGMNFQICHNVDYVGLSDSYEDFYQTLKRCLRFGQKEKVMVNIITSEIEGNVVRNIQRKDAQTKKMAKEMSKHMKKLNKANIKGIEKETSDYKEQKKEGRDWTAYQGDTVWIHQNHIESNSIDYSIFSPPFQALYTYSDLNEDMGNCKTKADFYTQYKYLINEQFRTLKPGRLLSFHCMNIPTTKTHDGYIGITDFRGELIRMYEKRGFIYHSEVFIWKDPVVAMQRTKAIGLLHKQLVKDSAMSRQGIPDYLITMRKPGKNAEPIQGEFDHYVGENSEKVGQGRFSIDCWQRYASPGYDDIEQTEKDIEFIAQHYQAWNDIRQGDTLQRTSARGEKDEKHICPLQLQVIHRALQMWTNKGDTVLTPFGGIGSEGYEALLMERKAILIELKESYYNQLVNNMIVAEEKMKERRLF